MAISEYLFTPKDIWQIIKSFFRFNTKKSIFGLVLLFCAVLFLWLTSTLNFENIFLLLFLFVVFYWNLSWKFSIGIALACFIVIPILFIVYRTQIIPIGEIATEHIAEWAFYFLLIGAIQQFWQYRTGTAPMVEPKQVVKYIRRKRRIPGL
jgi:hypothetical protein